MGGGQEAIEALSRKYPRPVQAPLITGRRRPRPESGSLGLALSPTFVQLGFQTLD